MTQDMIYRNHSVATERRANVHIHQVLQLAPRTSRLVLRGYPGFDVTYLNLLLRLSGGP